MPSFYNSSFLALFEDVADPDIQHDCVYYRRLPYVSAVHPGEVASLWHSLTCICVILQSSCDDRSVSDGSKLSLFSLFSQTKVIHFSFYCVCIIFTIIIMPFRLHRKVPGRLKFLHMWWSSHFFYQPPGNSVEAVRFMTCNRWVPRWNPERDIIYPEVLRGLPQSLQPISGMLP
jgi:hypothetical protein